MHDINGYDKTIEELLSGGSFGIDYYQRDYKWEQKQLQELVEDLIDCFLDCYNSGDESSAVKNYGHYFLGSIIISQSKDGSRRIVDGQQRLTSITILLIYLRNLQMAQGEEAVNIDSLIYADDYGEKKFKLNIPDRNDCMESLYNGNSFNVNSESESVRNLIARYYDLDELFPEDLRGEKLPLFIYWLIRKVKFIEIIAYLDDDAYTIFETMNDRGLSLTPTEMLRGYLLASINDTTKRTEANKKFNQYLSNFSVYGKETDSDFFKAWLRSKYSTKIRERRSNAKNEDFELIGSEYHRWVRNNTDVINLVNSEDYYNFIMRDFQYYAGIYQQLLDASKDRVDGLESILYNSDARFTLQHHVYLASVSPDDDFETAKKKVGVVADFIDCWLNLRFWNYKSNSYATMQYAVFLEIKRVRDKSLPEIRENLYNRLQEEYKEIDFSQPVGLNQFTSKAIHRQLARFVDWLEQKSGEIGNYKQYYRRTGRNTYEIEHIWSNHYDRFSDRFSQLSDFEHYRNQIGGLLLLPRKLNASLQDKTYEEKLPHYLKTNVLAQSLHSDFYKNNPGFLRAIEEYDLPFQSHDEFNKEELEARSQLYCKLASIIWSPDRLLDQESVQNDLLSMQSENMNQIEV